MSDDAVRAWLSSIGPGEHEFARLRSMWTAAGNSAVSDARLGRWLVDAGFSRVRRGKAKVTRYARGAAARVDATAKREASPQVDVSEARALARRFRQAVEVDAHKFEVVVVLFAEWCELIDVDAPSGDVLAAWLAEGGGAVDAGEMRRAA